MRFCELNDEAKLHATIWFNSEYDAYGINGTKEYPPADFAEMSDLSDSNGWEWDENGERTNL